MTYLTLSGRYCPFSAAGGNVIRSFPVVSNNQALAADDFVRFSRSFSLILLKRIPTAQSVLFISSEEELARSGLPDENIDGLVDLFRSLRKDRLPCGIFNDYLLISFDLSGEETVVAVCSRVDPVFNRRVSDDWLGDVRLEVTAEFLLLKQARIDDQTGLFNLSNLHSILDNLTTTQTVQLAVVEISAKYGSFQIAAGHLNKCVSSLKWYLPEGSIIHYLGNFVFAVAREAGAENDRSALTTSLASYLRREGFSRIHIGSSYRRNHGAEDLDKSYGQQLLDEAWTALQEATKRGPFGFCDYSLLASPEKHPLVRPDKNLVRRLRRLWRDDDKFCLVYFRSDNDSYSAAEIVAPLVNTGITVLSGSDLIVYHAGGNKEKINQWTKSIVGDCKNSNSEMTVSAGISCFPFCDFKKSETVHNCIKTLAHAAFFGDSGIASFDAVTLNISGDIYFSDGDLAKAVREYRRGLKCDGGNVNLNNSLGVTLALIGRFSEAESCFKKALELDGNSFMALYNLGLGELNRDRKKEAGTFFRRALLCCDDSDPDASSLENELRRQIGVLAAETGDYQDALTYLLLWYQADGVARQPERVAYYVGRSYYGLGQATDAMKWLQRSLQYDQYDHRAMHLLGRVYFEEGEGDEIALSLCQKSVELDPDNHRYRFELARIQSRSGLYPEALGNFKQSLKSEELRTESQLHSAKCCLEIGYPKRALNWFSKVDSNNIVSEDLYDYLSRQFGKLFNYDG
jgi:tetratricopeptide (TPR) repeat protein